jgi:hypothetical protein
VAKEFNEIRDPVHVVADDLASVLERRPGAFAS